MPFLAIANVIAVYISLSSLFHTLKASEVKLLFALVDLTTYVRSPRVKIKTAFWSFSINQLKKHLKKSKIDDICRIKA